MTAWLLAAVLALCSAIGGYFYGHSEGQVAEAGKRDAAAVQSLTQIIDSHTGLIKQANDASRKMRGALALRADADAKTTKDFHDALALHAAARVDCVFDDGVMRQLAAARDRAAQAAARGIQGALPGAASPARPESR